MGFGNVAHRRAHMSSSKSKERMDKILTSSILTIAVFTQSSIKLLYGFMGDI